MVDRVFESIDSEIAAVKRDKQLSDEKKPLTQVDIAKAIAYGTVIGKRAREY